MFLRSRFYHTLSKCRRKQREHRTENKRKKQATHCTHRTHRKKKERKKEKRTHAVEKIKWDDEKCKLNKKKKWGNKTHTHNNL